MTLARIEPLRTERIALSRIDPPDNPTRERMDGELLDELGEQIATRGQIQAIGVELSGDRYKIIFGHRRFVASQRKNLPDIRADIYPAGVEYALVMQASENANREDVNAAEEGVWLRTLYEKHCGEDFHRLVALTGMKEERCGRLLLLALGDPKVLDAVKANEISASVGLELNKIKRDDHRDYYLTHARTTGASVKLVKLWRAQSEQMATQDSATPPTDVSASTPSEPAPAIVHMCACCGGTHDVHDMEYVQVHRYCNKAHLERLRKKLAATEA